MNTQQLLQLRTEKGLQIAKTGKVMLSGDKWLVPSQTSDRQYHVTLGLDKKTCSCSDFEERHLTCKHIFAVQITITKSVDKQGNVTITKVEKVTYSQNWPAYDKAQITEKQRFMELLSDLLNNVGDIPNHIDRPKISKRDMIFASALKVYTQFSLRRFMSDLKEAQEKSFVVNAPCFASIGHFMQDEELTPILKSLIALSSLPLKTVETKFAIDSSGFRTTRFTQYCTERHGLGMKHAWLKAHICVGVHTNIITAVEITDEHVNDTVKFTALANETYENGFKVTELSADKGYASKSNYEFVDNIGGTAYIPFKQYKGQFAVVPQGHGIWRKMYGKFIFQQEEFMKHYHLRSNVESTFFMIKSKFNDILKSKSRTAQVNELLLKILCHNIVVINGEIKTMQL